MFRPQTNAQDTTKAQKSLAEDKADTQAAMREMQEQLQKDNAVPQSEEQSQTQEED